MAAKNNKNQPATKADLERFSTKLELKQVKKVLWHQILRVEEKVENVGEGLKRVEEKLTNKIDGIVIKLDRIANQLDGFVGRVDTLTDENEVGAGQIYEIRQEIKGHEKRISKLESSN